jgi:hypothetical protein
MSDKCQEIAEEMAMRIHIHFAANPKSKDGPPLKDAIERYVDAWLERESLKRRVEDES